MSGDDFFSSDQADQALFESLPSKIVNPKLKEEWFVSNPAGTSFKIANLGLRYSCGEKFKGFLDAKDFAQLFGVPPDKYLIQVAAEANHRASPAGQVPMHDRSSTPVVGQQLFPVTASLDSSSDLSDGPATTSSSLPSLSGTADRSSEDPPHDSNGSQVQVSGTPSSSNSASSVAPRVKTGPVQTTANDAPHVAVANAEQRLRQEKQAAKGAAAPVSNTVTQATNPVKPSSKFEIGEVKPLDGSPRAFAGAPHGWVTPQNFFRIHKRAPQGYVYDPATEQVRPVEGDATPVSSVVPATATGSSASTRPVTAPADDSSKPAASSKPQLPTIGTVRTNADGTVVYAGPGPHEGWVDPQRYYTKTRKVPDGFRFDESTQWVVPVLKPAPVSTPAPLDETPASASTRVSEVSEIGGSAPVKGSRR